MSNVQKSSFVIAVQQEMQRRGLNQPALERLSGVSQASIQRLLSGKFGLSRENHLAICRVLNIDPESGAAAPERKIRAVVMKGKAAGRIIERGVSEPPSAFNGHASIEIPDMLEINEAEAAAVLLARRNGGKEQLVLAAHLAELEPAAIEAVKAIANGKPLRAIECLARLGQSAGKRGGGGRHG